MYIKLLRSPLKMAFQNTQVFIHEAFIILNRDKASIVLDERFQFSCIEFELGIMVQILTFSCRSDLHNRFQITKRYFSRNHENFCSFWHFVTSSRWSWRQHSTYIFKCNFIFLLEKMLKYIKIISSNAISYSSSWNKKCSST